MSTNSPHETHFSVLGLPEDASDAQITEAYRRQLAAASGDAARRARIEEAYRVLANPITRKSYRRELQRRGEQSAPPAASPPAAPAGAPPEPRRAAGQRKRQGTAYLDTPAAPLPPAAGQAPPASGRAGRQRTVYVDDAGQPPPLAPGSPPARHPRARPKTELIGDTGPGAGAAPAAPRQPTVVAQPPQPAARRKPVTDPASGPPTVTEEAGTAPTLELSYRGRRRVFALRPGENLIGRPPRQGDPPDIPIEDDERYVSRRHAMVRVEASGCSIEDLKSDNGTSLNGQRLEPERAYPLKDGDVIQIQGRELRLHIPEPRPGAGS